MRSLNLFLAFIIEIVAFVSFAAIGFLLPTSVVFQIISALALFTLLVIFWGKYMSPRAPKKVGLKLYYLVKFTLYAVAAVSLFYKYGQLYTIIFAALSIFNEATLFNYNKSQLK